MAIAILNASGQVVTFVRADLPEGWQPPEGCTAVPESELPPAWQRAQSGAIPSLTQRQLRRWLITSGIPLAAVQAQITAIKDPKARDLAQVDWDCAQTYERGYPLVEAVGGALGLTAAQLDAAFLEASQL